MIVLKFAMLTSRINLARAFVLSLVAAALCLPSAGTRAATRAEAHESQSDQGVKLATSPEAGRGLEAYETGDFENAVKLLKRATKKRKDDAHAWHFLGLAYARRGDGKEARKALALAVQYRLLQLMPVAVANTKKLYNEWTLAEREAARQRYAVRYREALASVESYRQLNPPDADFWREQANSLKFYAQHSETTEASKTLFQFGDEGLVKAVIHKKPEPFYTEKARAKQRTGTVLLRCVLDVDGTVKHILVLRFLPDGLTENAVAVARGISFTPAIKDGRPVPYMQMLEYNFNIF